MSKLSHHRLDQAKASFIANAKTFALAAKFLPKERYEAVARLYAFCRQLDDLADAAPAGVNHSGLIRIREEICSGTSQDPGISDMLCLQRDFEIPTTLLLDFVDALIEDQYPRALADMDELVRFAYGVASTVGLMMCHVFGVRDPKALPFAVDLGVAMQMSNIARDILEDAERNRIYVPANLLPTPVDCDGLVRGDKAQRASAYQGALKLLAIADEYYASAALGYGYLPRTVRQAIKVAARLYQAIGEKVERSEATYWQQRTVVSSERKCLLIAELFLQRMRNGSSTLLINKFAHRAQLHQALDSRRFSA
ncbi:MAG: squalene/phytoene synthase family protein [Proteobacteria bacterium]|nr:squalene/phytoene synthase family protein [Pseudomonadota bacterium]